MKEKNSKKSNVLVLTIIAIATMLVVVVGATFAYLASQTNFSDSADIEATTTGSSDILVIDAGDDLDLTVFYNSNTSKFESGNGEEFSSTGDDATDATVTASPYVQYISQNGAQEYNVTLNISENDFVYTSGTCYAKSGSFVNTEDTEADCAADGNYWGVIQGETTAACYDKSNLTENSVSNKILCVSSANNLWVQTKTPELVLDLYKGNSSSDSDTCIASGKCVKRSDNTIISATSSADCINNQSGRWVANVYKDGVCYNLDKTVDLTERTTNYTLYSNVSIASSGASAVTHYYYSTLRFLNLGHNQIDNLEKTFSSTFDIELVSE